MKNRVIFMMGVSGSGKSLIGQSLADEISVTFIDADDYHPKSNIEKMSKGIPLVDSDREPWLDKLHEIAKAHLESGCVMACSALKEGYRTRLSQSIESKVAWVYLKGTYDQIYERMKNRERHFMTEQMLQSQFDTLEEPQNVITIDISDTPEVIVENIKLQLK